MESENNPGIRVEITIRAEDGQEVRTTLDGEGGIVAIQLPSGDVDVHWSGYGLKQVVYALAQLMVTMTKRHPDFKRTLAQQLRQIQNENAAVDAGVPLTPPGGPHVQA